MANLCVWPPLSPAPSFASIVSYPSGSFLANSCISPARHASITSSLVASPCLEGSQRHYQTHSPQKISRPVTTPATPTHPRLIELQHVLLVEVHRPGLGHIHTRRWTHAEPEALHKHVHHDELCEAGGDAPDGVDAARRSRAALMGSVRGCRR